MAAHSLSADAIGLGNDTGTPVQGASFDGVVGSNTSMNSGHLSVNHQVHNGSSLSLLEDAFRSDSGGLVSGFSNLGPDVRTGAFRASSTNFPEESMSGLLPRLPGPQILVSDAGDFKIDDGIRQDFAQNLAPRPLRPLPRTPGLSISVPDVSEVKENDGDLLPSISTDSIVEHRPPPPMRPPPPPPPIDTLEYDDSSQHSNVGPSGMAASPKTLTTKKSVSFFGKIKPKNSRSHINDHGGDSERSLPKAGPSFTAPRSALKSSNKTGASVQASVQKKTRFHEDSKTGQSRSPKGIEGDSWGMQGNGSKEMSFLDANGKEKYNNRGNEAKTARKQTLKSDPEHRFDLRTSKLKPLLLGGTSSKEKTPAEDREAVKAALARNSSKANHGIPVRGKSKSAIGSSQYLPSDSLMRDQHNDNDDEDGDDSDGGDDRRGLEDAISGAWHSITARKPKAKNAKVKHSKNCPKGIAQRGGLGVEVYQPAQNKSGFFSNPFSKSKKEPVKTDGFQLRMPLEGSWIRDDPVGSPPPVPGTYAATASWTPDTVFGGREGASSIEEIMSGRGPSILLPNSRMSFVEFMRQRPRSATSATSASSATSQNVQKSKSSQFLMVPEDNRSRGHARSASRKHGQVKVSPTSAAVGPEANTSSQTAINSLPAPRRPTPNLSVQVPEITLRRPDQSQQQIQTRRRKRAKTQTEMPKGPDRSDKSEKPDRRPV